MGAVCAIVALDGSRADPAILDAMVRSSAGRGPDGTRTFAIERAALAHLALHATPESRRERLPATIAPGPVVLTADARIDNRAELDAALRGSGHLTEASPTDADLIAAAWRRFGAECPRRLVGDFAFVIWDGRTQELFAARDALGARPLHFALTGRCFYAATDAAALLDCPGVDRRIDESAVAAHLLGEEPDEAGSAFAAIRRIPPAHTLHLRDGRVRLRRYWSARDAAPVRYCRTADYAAHYLDLLRRSVLDRLRRPGGPVSVLLSGGLDSGTVASLAGRELERSGESASLRAYHFAFPAVPGCDERAPCAAVAAAVRAPVETFLDQDYPLLPDSPAPVEGPAPGWETLESAMFGRIRDAGSRVALTGLVGGVGHLGGGRWIYADRLLRGQIRRVGREIRWFAREKRISILRAVWSVVLKPLLPDPALEFLRGILGRAATPSRPDWVARGLLGRTRCEAVSRFPSGAAILLGRHRPGIRRRLNGLGLVGEAVAHWGRAAERFSVETRHPFLDRRVMEYMCAIPPEHVFTVVWNRPLLRQAVEGIVPDSVRLIARKARYSPVYGPALRRERSRVRDLLTDPVSARLGFVDDGGSRPPSTRPSPEMPRRRQRRCCGRWSRSRTG